MNRPLLVLRPEPGLAQTLALATTMGLRALGAPLFEIEPVPWTAPAAETFDGILAGSANAFRHGGSSLASLAKLPVHAVGQRTADAARTAGFTVATAGATNLQRVLDQLAPPLRLLRLAGEKRVMLEAPQGIEIEERALYRARPLALGHEAADLLLDDAIALLHSGEAARHFAQECARLGIDRAGVAIAALAPRIAEAAGTGWREVATAQEPSDRALLVMAADMCQTGVRNGVAR
ncbi:uroporphyrinogen-III synthase [Tsuneonella deserti]|nr:uroporphyrinogen-III synthase [Tsuneonella deserti]